MLRRYHSFVLFPLIFRTVPWSRRQGRIFVNAVYGSLWQRGCALSAFRQGCREGLLETVIG
jgi:hypothetical protein